MEMLGSSIHAMIETRRFVMARRKRGGEIVGMEQPVLMIHCDEAAVHEIEQTFVTHGIAYQSSGRRNLDGAALTSWLVLAGVAVKVAPDLIRALTEFIRRHQVQRIEYGSLVIDRPRPEDVDAIVKKITAGEAFGSITRDKSSS
jgi:hypothetical protein